MTSSETFSRSSGSKSPDVILLYPVEDIMFTEHSATPKALCSGPDVTLAYCTLS